jgi:hypothetical protein
MTEDEANEKVCDFYRETLSFCACGDPARIAELLRAGLEWAAAIQTREGRESTDTQLLVAYILDAHEMTEHGGSVTGAWLTPAGEDLLEALRSCGDDWIDAGYEAY